MGFYDRAAAFVGRWEGFNQQAVWDVNAWRIGHGSDTITFSNGSYRKVVPGDVTTRENAQRDLARRIPEFEKKIMAKVGADNYRALPEPTRIALISFAYNYGNIVKQQIRSAIATRNVDKIADAVWYSTLYDNYGTKYYNGLRKRRAAEAALIRSQRTKSTPDLTLVAAAAAVIGGIMLLRNDKMAA